MLLVTSEPHCQRVSSDLSDLKLHNVACVSACGPGGYIREVLKTMCVGVLRPLKVKSRA